MLIPGLKVVALSTARDAHGLMMSAVADSILAMYLEHKELFGSERPLDTSQAPIPMCKAKTVRTGQDATVVGSLAMVPMALEAAMAYSPVLRDATITLADRVVQTEQEVVAR